MCRRARRVGALEWKAGCRKGRVNVGCGRVRRFEYGTLQVENG